MTPNGRRGQARWGHWVHAGFAWGLRRSPRQQGSLPPTTLPMSSAACCISKGLVRLSAGLKVVADILGNVRQALDIAQTV